MKRDFVWLVALAAILALTVLGWPGSSRAGEKKPDVSKIYGRIQFVSSFPDYKVQVVNNFADLKVEMVESFPDKPGRWQIVNSFPDYKIQLVKAFPDFSVEYVKVFPGPNK